MERREAAGAQDAPVTAATRVGGTSAECRDASLTHANTRTADMHRAYTLHAASRAELGPPNLHFHLPLKPGRCTSITHYPLF